MPPPPDIWEIRHQLASRYGNPKRARDRIGIVLAGMVNEIGAVWPSSRYLQLAVLTRWPDLLDAPKQGRRAAGVAAPWFRQVLAAHPDWVTVGYRARPNGERGVAVRMLRDDVRKEIGLEITLAEGVASALESGLIRYLERAWRVP